MPCEILIAAKDLNHSKRGYPKNVKDIPCVWGKKECPPGYVILRITDASADQVEHFMQQWLKMFSYQIVNENEQGYRIRITVDPALISASNINKELRAELKDDIQTTYAASIYSYDGYEAVVDVPKPIVADAGKKTERVLTLQELKAEIHDKFAEVIDHRFHYFDSNAVDYALLQPSGIVERTKVQALAMVRNKLDE